MHKSEMVRRVAAQTRLSQQVVLDVVNASHQLIEETLRSDESMTVPGFGTFYPNKCQEGTIRDVRTGEMVSFPARNVAVFRAGDVSKRAVAGKRCR